MPRYFEPVCGMITFLLSSHEINAWSSSSLLPAYVKHTRTNTRDVQQIKIHVNFIIIFIPSDTLFGSLQFFIRTITWSHNAWLCESSSSPPRSLSILTSIQQRIKIKWNEVKKNTHTHTEQIRQQWNVERTRFEPSNNDNFYSLHTRKHSMRWSKIVCDGIGLLFANQFDILHTRSHLNAVRI